MVDTAGSAQYARVQKSQRQGCQDNSDHNIAAVQSAGQRACIGCTHAIIIIIIIFAVLVISETVVLSRQCGLQSLDRDVVVDETT